MKTQIIRTEFPKDEQQFSTAFMSAYELAKKLHNEDPSSYHFMEVEVPYDQLMSMSFNGRDAGINVALVRIGNITVFADDIGLIESTPGNYVMSLMNKGECIALSYFSFVKESAITVSEMSN